MLGSSNNQTATFVEHLAELRKRIVLTLVVLVLTMFIGFAVATPVIEYLRHAEPASDMEWNVFSPWDSIRIYMNVAFGIGVILTLPYALYQIWAFVKPGLRKEEQRASLIFVPFAFLLALGGLAFGYYVVFPMTFYFTSFMTSNLGLTETYGVAQYLGFMFNILVPLAIFFELPIVVMFLTKLRIVNPRILHKFRRFAYFFLFIIAAIITPSPDLASAVVVTIPMALLYEVSVLLSRSVYRKQKAADQAFEN